MDNIITLNNREFLIVREVTYKDNDYIYAIATDGSNDIALVKVLEENGNFLVESVTNKEDFDEILKLIK